MNPLFQAVVSSVMRRKRMCPKCKRSQAVPANKKHYSVPCKFCGTEMPPNK